MASSREPGRTASSSLTAMRMAWKVRRAGWPALLRRAGAGTAPATTSASSSVVAMGRWATMARLLRAYGDERHAARIARASSSASAPLTRSAALTGRAGSIRMSSGPAAR